MKRNYSVAGLVLYLVVVQLMTGCALPVSHPSDQVLEQRLRARQADFDKLVHMLEEDPDVVTITYKNAFMDPPSTRQLSKERLEEYRRLFKELHLDGGLQRDRKGFILFIASIEGMVIPNSGKTYVYSLTEPSPLVESLDEVVKSQRGDQPPVYKKLFDKWYLLYESW